MSENNIRKSSELSDDALGKVTGGMSEQEYAEMLDGYKVQSRWLKELYKIGEIDWDEYQRRYELLRQCKKDAEDKMRAGV